MPLFVSLPGRVAVVNSTRESLPGKIYVRNSGGANVSLAKDGVRVVITGMVYDQQTHTQFQQTLLNAIYMYSFGDKLSTIQLTGICFNSYRPPGDCDTLNDGMRDDSGYGTGVNDILDVYQQLRVSKNNLPIIVMIGTRAIRGFLVGCRTQTLNPEHLTSTFVLTIQALPESMDRMGT